MRERGWADPSVARETAFRKLVTRAVFPLVSFLCVGRGLAQTNEFDYFWASKEIDLDPGKEI
jgi:hypothetical protein